MKIKAINKHYQKQEQNLEDKHRFRLFHKVKLKYPELFKDMKTILHHPKRFLLKLTNSQDKSMKIIKKGL